MEYWNDVEDKKTKIHLNPLFHHSIIPLFQLRSEAELSSEICLNFTRVWSFLRFLPPVRFFQNMLSKISNIGASTRIENAVLTDQEIEWIDTALNKNGKVTAFEENRGLCIFSAKNSR